MHKSYTRIAENSPRAVLCIHGIVGSPDQFRPFYPLIPADVSVYSILLEGHGGTVSDFAHASMDQWKAQVCSTLETLLARHEEIIILAHSMGTLFALQAAVAHPERIRQLFLLAVPLIFRLTPTAAWVSLKVALNAVAPGDPLGQAAKAACSVRPTKKLWQYLPWLPRFWELFLECRRTRGMLSRIAVPCTAYQSKKDELVAPGADRLLTKAGIPVKPLPDSGHFFYAPDDLALLLEDFSRLMG